MLVFREEKSAEEEAKAWQFWHGRQHSAKQRILDAGNLPFHRIHFPSVSSSAETIPGNLPSFSPSPLPPSLG